MRNNDVIQPVGVFYGQSDDSICFNGDSLTFEHGIYPPTEKGLKFTFSDGTKGIICFNGNWRIEVKRNGTNLINQYNPDAGLRFPSRNDSKALQSINHDTEDGDALIFATGIKWVQLGYKRFEMKSMNRGKKKVELHRANNEAFRKEMITQLYQSIIEGEFGKIQSPKDAKILFANIIDQSWELQTLPF